MNEDDKNVTNVTNVYISDSVISKSSILGEKKEPEEENLHGLFNLSADDKQIATIREQGERVDLTIDSGAAVCGTIGGAFAGAPLNPFSKYSASCASGDNTESG